MAKTQTKTRHFDKRLFRRYVDKGAISQADFDAHLEALPDMAEEAENIADIVYAQTNEAQESADIPTAE